MSSGHAFVVEDDPDIQGLLSRSLARLGSTVTVFSTGEAACRALDTVRPDIVLLDLHLPGVDGETVLRHLRAGPDTSAVPVLVVSVADVGSLDHLDVDGWLVKPFTVAEVTEQVQRLLDRPGEGATRAAAD